MTEAAKTTTPARHTKAWKVGLGAAIALAILAGGAYLARRQADPEALWTRAKEEFEARRFDRSAALLDRVAALRAATPLDHLLRAQLEMAAGRTDPALAELDALPDDHPLAPQARLQAGQLELRRNRFVPAEHQFRRALKLDPGRIQARRELIYIFGMQLRRAELNANFRALAELAPLNYGEAFLWCLTRGVTWEPLELITTLSKCVEADPSDRWSRLALAESLREVSRLDDAEATLAPLGPDDPDARAARVRLALAQGDDADAEALLAAGPDDHLGLALLRGQFALVHNDGRAALRHYRIANDRAPHTREPAFGLGQALQMTGDAAAAAPYLEEARKHDKLGSLVQKAASDANRADPALIRDLAAACVAVGRLPEARAWYNIAIARDPLDAQAQQGIDRINRAEQAAPTAP